MEYVQRIEAALGIRFEIVDSQNWEEILAKARAGEVDVIGNIQRTDSRDRFLLFTEPYISIPNAIVTRDKNRHSLTLGDLDGHRVAIVKGYATEQLIQEQFPSIHLMPVRDTFDGLQAVSFGSADAMVTDLAVASYLIEQHGIANLRVAGTVPEHTWQLAFACRRDWPVFAQILDKALKTVSAEERQTIYSRWISHEIPRPMWKKWSFYAVLGLLLLIAWITARLWMKSLRNLVAKRTNELRESEAEFRNLANTLPVAIYLSAGLEQVCSYLNPAFTQLFGYTIEDVPSVAEWWPKAYPDPHYRDSLANEWNDKVATALETRQPIQPMETIVTCKDGTTKNIHWGYINIGEKSYAYGLDLTGQRTLEEKLRQHRNQLEEQVEQRTAELKTRKEEAETLNRGMINLLSDLKESNQQLEQAQQTLRQTNLELESFFYSVTHDLRAPLRHINGFVQMLLKRESGTLDETSARYLETISQSSDRMGRLIDDLLAFSRTGRAAMTLREVDSNKTIQAVIDELSPLTKDRRIVWDIADLPPAVADHNLLRQVWSNLIGNAIKYTANRDEARIEIGATHKKDGTEPEKTVFFVRDNGAGFDPQYTHKLFGVFQRLHRDVEFEGTGIGLATVQRIILRHGGKVWAEGKVNEGATFYFTLKDAHK